MEESAATGVQRAKRRDSRTERISADQHLPAREAHLLTHRGGLGLGAEARTSEVGSQGEDWDWLREHRLKGASAPRLAGRASGKKSGAAEEARDHCFGVRRRGGSQHHLNELQRLVRAAAIGTDTRDGCEMLRLLLQPPRSLCASTGHYPHLTSQEPVQPATTRVPWHQDNFPGRMHGTPQAVATSCQALPPQDHPAFCTPPSPWPE